MLISSVVSPKINKVGRDLGNLLTFSSPFILVSLLCKFLEFMFFGFQSFYVHLIVVSTFTPLYLYGSIWPNYSHEYILNCRCDHVVAIDIDQQKVEHARHNAKIYGVDENIDFVKGDFFCLAPKLKVARLHSFICHSIFDENVLSFCEDIDLV